MKTRTISIFALAVLILLFSAFPPAAAQNGKNINFLRVVPQSSYTNPAIVPPYDFYIGFPALSSLKLDFKNTPFDFNDVIKTNDKDSLYLDTQAMMNSLKNKNYLLFDFSNEFIAFGFRAKDFFISFNFSEKFTTSLMYPKEFISLLVNGNAPYIGTTVNAGGLDINITHYHELALGLSYTISKNWSAGLRAKYLVGVLNLDTKKTNINLYSPDEFSITASTDILVNMSIPGNNPNKEDSLSFNIDSDDFLRGFYGFKNSGFAFDLGAQFQPIEKLTLGLSVTDVGFIHWRTGVQNLVTNNNSSSYTFNAIDIGEMFSSDSVKFSDQLTEVLDSLKKNLGLRVTYDNYYSWLTPKLYASVIYDLTPKDHFGFLWRCDFFKGNLLPSVSLNYTREFGKAFSLLAGYTVATNSYANFALGFAVNAGPVQLYLMTDNILGITQLTNTRYANTHFGINLVFGRNKWYNKPKIKVDDTGLNR